MKKVVLFKSFSEDYKETFAKSGLDVTFIEPLQFSFLNLSVLTEKLFSINYTGIILTSPRAVEAVSKCWKGNTSIWNKRKIYTVGEASAQKIKYLLNLTAIGTQSGNAENLSKIIIQENTKDTKFLFPCGNLKSETLIENLTSKEIGIDPITVYETEENHNLINHLKYIIEQEIKIFFFFSPSGVEMILKHLKNMQVDLKYYKLVAIGPSTSKKLSAHGIAIHGVAEKPTANCLIEVYNKLSSS